MPQTVLPFIRPTLTWISDNKDIKIASHEKYCGKRGLYIASSLLQICIWNIDDVDMETCASLGHWVIIIIDCIMVSMLYKRSRRGREVMTSWAMPLSSLVSCYLWQGAKFYLSRGVLIVRKCKALHILYQRIQHGKESDIREKWNLGKRIVRVVGNFNPGLRWLRRDQGSWD